MFQAPYSWIGCQRKNKSLTLVIDEVGDGGQLSHLTDASRRCPEEGHRLIRAFLTIKEARLREALVFLVEELSRRRH